MSTARPALALVVLILLAAPSAAEPPTTEQLRETVGRSLPFLEKEGVAWMRNFQCVTCHQVPMLLWTTHEARRRGFPVDADALAARTNWAFNGVLDRGILYKLTDKSFADLKKAEVDQASITKLEGLKDKTFSLEADFRQELAKLLPAEEAGKHQDLLLKAATIPSTRDRNNMNNQYVALLLAGAYADTKGAEEARKAFVTGLVKTQKKDGSWDSIGQIGFGKEEEKRPQAETLEVATLWAALALASVKDLPEPAVQAGQRAREFLKDSKPGVSTESLLLHAMLAKVDGDEKRLQSLVGDLLKLQQEDGGWSWLREGAPSDPFATGEVLYGLTTLGRDRTDASVQKACKFLLGTQKPDGSWHMTRKMFNTKAKVSPNSKDAVYTYWATGWAVVGLLQTLPE